jgi:hypothetical protein
MQNSLENFIEKNGMNPEKAMNVLQRAGIVSDNAIFAGDVAEADFTAAKKFLSKYLAKWLRD